MSIADYMHRRRLAHHSATGGAGSLSQCLHLLADLGVDGKELAHAAINAYALALVEIGLSVAWADALGVTRFDKAVEHVRNHIELSRSRFQLGRRCRRSTARAAATKETHVAGKNCVGRQRRGPQRAWHMTKQDGASMQTRLDGMGLYLSRYFGPHDG